MHKRTDNLIGNKYGRLTVMDFYDYNKYGQATWVCACDCGNTSIVRSSDLKTGRIRSCGCLWQERIREAKTTHGMSYSNVYAEYRNMKRRCYDENSHNYNYYGGRGIKMCDRWRDDINEFHNDVSVLPHFGEEGYTLDRIDNDGNYEPGNVRWATYKEQSNNRRPRSCKHMYEYDGEMRSLKEISSLTGVSYRTLLSRITKGWDPKIAINTEVQEKFRHKSIR